MGTPKVQRLGEMYYFEQIDATWDLRFEICNYVQTDMGLNVWTWNSNNHGFKQELTQTVH